MLVVCQAKKLALVLTIFLSMIMTNIKANSAIDSIIKKSATGFQIPISASKTLLSLKPVFCIYYLGKFKNDWAKV